MTQDQLGSPRVIKNEDRAVTDRKDFSAFGEETVTAQRSSEYSAAEAIKTKTDDEVQIINTICSATKDRQESARALAGMVDAFFIIGGRHSSNSMKLLGVCKEQCEKSFLIETEDEINIEDLVNVKTVGVTAGASTPEWLIQKVVEHLKSLGDLSGEMALK